MRPEPRLSAAKQLAVIDVPRGKIWQEEHRKRGDEYPMRDALIASIRPQDSDTVVVSDLHRLASTTHDLAEALKEIFGKNATIEEARTARTSAEPNELAAMIFEAITFYAQRALTTAEAKRIGKLGAAASPATKPTKGRMPLAEALKIWRDPQYGNVRVALAVINHDRRFKVKYTQAYAYRKLGKRMAPAGRRPKG